MSNDIEILQTEIKNCKRCVLCKQRNSIVFGVGNESSKILFIGEGPGADEDKQGIPFVGKAGQLLTKIFESVGLNREDYYISNVVKCRPPNNRNPKNEEMRICSYYLFQQIKIMQPKIIVTLGSVATKFLLGPLAFGITRMRGKFYEYDKELGIEVFPTYHPSYLLRNESREKNSPKYQCWEDFKKIAKKIKELENR